MGFSDRYNSEQLSSADGGRKFLSWNFNFNVSSMQKFLSLFLSALLITAIHRYREIVFYIFTGCLLVLIAIATKRTENLVVCNDTFTIALENRSGVITKYRERKSGPKCDRLRVNGILFCKISGLKTRRVIAITLIGLRKSINHVTVRLADHPKSGTSGIKHAAVMNSEETVPPVSKKSLDRNYRIVAQGKYGGNRNFISFDRNKSEGRKFLVVFAQSELGFAHWTDFPIGEARNSHFEGYFLLRLTVNNVFKVFEHFGLPIQVSDQEATLICVAFYRLKAFNDDQTGT
ncbi:hypothetical protein HUJ04_008373 [Dendroctonus ponderosae]|nr:hypothetical protein HUJ04_008373 [Dendroctonus ponderosae]